jgi:hypothetical protein
MERKRKENISFQAISNIISPVHFIATGLPFARISVLKLGERGAKNEDYDKNTTLHDECFTKWNSSLRSLVADSSHVTETYSGGTPDYARG